MPKPDSKIFTKEDFNQADQVDRLYIHLMDPEAFPLTFDDDDRLEILRKVWAVMCKHGSHRARVKRIADLEICTQKTVNKYMDQARYLFGDVFKVDAEFELGFLKEKYYSLAAKAENAKDYETARKCYGSAMEIIMDAKRNTPKAKREFAAIVFTDNPKALNRALNAEDAEFEDLEEGDLLELEAVRVPAGATED